MILSMEMVKKLWDRTSAYGPCVLKGCDAGHYKPLASSTCVDVDAGQVSAAGDLAQRACTGTTVSNSNKDACVACTGGEAPNNDHTACEVPVNITDCSADVTDGSGSRSNGGPCEITGCDAGFYEQDSSSGCVQVSNSYISEAGSLAQTECTGRNKPNTAKDTCENCSLNQHTEDNISCVSNTRSCDSKDGQGEQSWNTDTDGWNPCEPTSCETDFWEVNKACVAVGNGYYSVDTGNDSLTREPCSNGGANVSYTSSGGGADSCTYACVSSFRKDKSNHCVAIQNRDCATRVPHGVASGTQTYNPISEEWEGTCTFTSCKEDYYRDVATNNCELVGNGYYSSSTGANSLKKLACGDLGGSISNGQFTSDGDGADKCSFTCTNGFHKDSGSSYTCVSNTDSCVIANGVGRKTWNPTLNSDAGNWNDCRVVSCGTDFYKTGSGVTEACTPVAEGEYSGSASSNKGTCSNKPSTAKYTGKGGGSNNCPWACNEGYWKDSSSSCDLTPENFYSVERSNDKLACNNPNKPATDAHYTRKGETSVNCQWACDTSFVLDGGTCVHSSTLANIGNVRWEALPSKSAEASYDFSQLRCKSTNADIPFGDGYRIFLKKIWFTDANDVEESVFYHYTKKNGPENLYLHSSLKGNLSESNINAITSNIMNLLVSQRRASGPVVPYTRQGRRITFVAPEGTGASWNGKKIKVRVETARRCIELHAYSGWYTSAQVAFSFQGGLDEDAGVKLSKGVLPIQDCFKASGRNNSITIDGVDIDLGSVKLTRLKIAEKIANTDFSAGGTYSTNPYAVSFNNHAEVIFTLNTPVAITDNVSIPITDPSYTRATGACDLQSCDEDYYLSDGACVPVGYGYYSADGDLPRTSCNDANGGTVVKGRFTSSGEGSDDCDFACDLGYHKDGNPYICENNIRACNVPNGTGEELWDPRRKGGSGDWSPDCLVASCAEDHYENNDACEAVENGEYSVASSLSKGACTGKPASSKYTSSGGGSATGCSWACDIGRWNDSGTCEETPRGFWSGEEDNQKHACNGKPSGNVYTRTGEQTANCENVLGSRACAVADGVTSGTQTWNVVNEAFEGACTIDSCNEDFYQVSNECVAVGNGYYSVASGNASLNRVDCGGKGGVITNGQFTGSGGGTDNCSFTCNSNHHKSITDAFTCVSSIADCQITKGRGTKTWDTKAGSNGAFGTCTVKDCDEDYYKNGNDCDPVGEGYYSGANSSVSLFFLF